MIDSDTVASRETKEEGGKDGAEQVRLWMDAIAIASKEEKGWRKTADAAVKVYRLGSDTDNRKHTFNVLHSNVETTVPAIYNSVPVPDVRRRFQDDDPAGNEVCDLLERCISYSVDSYDFDCTLRLAVKDMELPGRGVVRVRYVPYVEGDEVKYEEVTCEHVQWKHFRRGPGRYWDDVPWIAFELFLTREQLLKLSPKEGGKVDLDCEVEGLEDKGDGRNPPEIFKRARVWEIWDKDAREVIFIAESKKDRPLRVESDPLGLTAFLPIPRPLYAIDTSDSLVPVVPYDVYRDQAEELERVSQRIMGLMEALKARGVYDGRLTEIARVADAEDNELISVEAALNYAESGLEKAISWWPIDVISAVLERLYLQRDQIKNAIYEITGISDILRGETDAAETATAQQIKSQWGSLRIQRKQQEVQRFARDLFRLKAEIIANKFGWDTIQVMTGLQYPSQQQKAMLQQQAQMAQAQQQPVPPQMQKLLATPSREEVEVLLRNDALRGFRIDVESDSTIRSDMTRNQTMMSQFLQGIAEFAQALGPAITEGVIPKYVAVEILSAFSRNFRLGKQAEDALDRFADQAKQEGDQPKPDPKMQAEQAKAQAEQQKLQMEMQAKQAENQMKMQMMQAELQVKQAELELKKEELALKEREMGMKAQMQEREMAMKAEMGERQMAMDAQAMDRHAQFDQQQSMLAQEAADHKHSLGMEMMEFKAKQAKQQPRARA